MKLPSWLRSFWSGTGVGIIVVAVLFIVGVLSWLAFCYWWDWSCREWLVTGSDCRESGSTTLRNLGFVVGGLLAIGFGIWRGFVADHQAKASQDQAKTSRRGLLNERYQKGAEMLGSSVLAVRLGGIFALQHLAEDEPKRYHVQVMRLFCAFVLNPRKDEILESRHASQPLTSRIREDVQAAMRAISNRNDGDIELERKEPFRLHLVNVDLDDADLSGANLTDANLAFANLTSVNLRNAILTNVHLPFANLTGTDFSGAVGVAQDELDQARADPNSPPKLDGARDSESGAPLEWRGGAISPFEGDSL